MDKILVIGGAGYIGSHVTYELCDQGYKVYVLDDLSTGYIENIDKRSDFIQGTFTDEKFTAKILKNVDCVIHLAALKAAGDSMINPIKFSNHNIIDSIQLINNCAINKIKKFIFSSSAAVYGIPQYLPIDEEHPLNPVNYYGFTKLIIEKQLSWYKKLNILKVASLRYFNAAGYDMNGRILMPEKNVDNLLPVIMEVASGERDKFEIYGNDYDTKDGTCTRDYIHVSDLANAHAKSVDYLNKNINATFNLATGNSYSVLDVLKKAELVTNKKIRYNFAPRRPGDPAKLYAVSNNVNNSLNWHPEHSDLENILKTMWQIYK